LWSQLMLKSKPNLKIFSIDKFLTFFTNLCTIIFIFVCDYLLNRLNLHRRLSFPHTCQAAR
jgi:hypothetical protein